MKNVTFERRGTVRFVRQKPWWRDEKVVTGLAVGTGVAVLIAVLLQKVDRRLDSAPMVTPAVPAITAVTPPVTSQPPVNTTVPPVVVASQPSVPMVTNEIPQSVAAAHTGQSVVDENPTESVTKPLSPEAEVRVHKWWADWYARQMEKDRAEQWKMFYDLGVEFGEKGLEKEK